MGISIRFSGGITLVGVLCIVGAIILEYVENSPDKYWKLFYAGIGITILGIFLVIRSGHDNR